VDDPDDADWNSKNRRLLNTEKIIFKAEGSNPVSVDQSSTSELICFLPAESQWHPYLKKNLNGMPMR